MEYRFHIVNLEKPSSLYNQGMLPLVFSEKEAEANGRRWFRGGYGVRYYPNYVHKKRDRTAARRCNRSTYALFCCVSNELFLKLSNVSFLFD